MQNSLSSYFKKREKVKEPPVNYLEERPQYIPPIKSSPQQPIGQTQEKIKICLAKTSYSSQNEMTQMSSTEVNKLKEQGLFQNLALVSPKKANSHEDEDTYPQMPKDQNDNDHQPSKDPLKERQITTSSSKKPTQSEKRSFREEWKKLYPGLNYDRNLDLVTCEICQKYSAANIKGQNVFIVGTKKKKLTF